MLKKEFEAAWQYKLRRDRVVYPDGTFDSQGRWYMDASEICNCCKGIRTPSRSYPYSQMTHCRTIKHVAQLYDVEVKAIKNLTPFIENISKELHRIQITNLLRELPDEFTFQDIKREALKFLLKEA